MEQIVPRPTAEYVVLRTAPEHVISLMAVEGVVPEAAYERLLVGALAVERLRRMPLSWLKAMASSPAWEL